MAAALGIVAAIIVLLTPEPPEPAQPVVKKVDESAESIVTSLAGLAGWLRQSEAATFRHDFENRSREAKT